MLALGAGLFLDGSNNGTSAWLPTANGVSASVYADFAGNNNYFYNGARGSFANWLTGLGGTFAGSANGTYVNSSGLITQASSNVPRFETGGILLEGARTNLALYSADLSNAVWSTFGGATNVGVAGSVSPDGTSNAREISFGATGGAIGSASAFFQSNITMASGSTYTYSIWLRAKTGTTTARISVFDPSGANQNSGDISLTTTWTRYSVTITSAGTGAGGHGDVRNNVAGNSANVYAFGGQIELASFASSYIPTTSASVTRAADALVATSGGLFNLITGANATSIIMAFADSQASTSNAAYALQGADGNKDVYFRLAAASNTTLRSYSDDTTTLDATLGSGAFSSAFKVGIGFDGTGRSLVGNAGTVATDSKTFASDGPYQIGGGSNVYSFAHLSQFSVFPIRATNAELQRLTT